LKKVWSGILYLILINIMTDNRYSHVLVLFILIKYSCKLYLIKYIFKQLK
jgi:hypothetical protein